MTTKMSAGFFVLLVAAVLTSTATADGVRLLESGRAEFQIVCDQRGTTPAGATVLKDAASWLADSLQRASGAVVPIVDEVPEGATCLIIARTDAWPELARSAGLTTDGYDDYAIVTQAKQRRVYVLGVSEVAARHGVADLLRRLGFRWFAPSPRWHTAPQLRDWTVDLRIVESPRLIERRIWYAYGMSGEDLKPLMNDYIRWTTANRLTLRGLTRTGHSYGNIIGRNQEAFATHPEFSAQLPDGNRDTSSSPQARKFCVSNPQLVDLVVADRRRLLEEQRRAIPSAFMVSVDPSDGQGTCHCENCRRLGTTTDRVFHLANQVAKRLRAADPRAWVGLYAYSSHRLPPTVDVEPNVYVQVAMGFNRTEYSLPELVERWSEKVSAIGLREYYGVEAWDWGLPGRARGGRVGYHRKWIPYYAERNLNGINAETNANWGAQAMGLYVASQLMWNPDTEVDPLVDEFLQLLFEDAAEPMRAFYSKMESAPPLRSATLLPLFDDLQTAWDMSASPQVRARLCDLMAYMVYVAEFREFERIRGRNPQRGDTYYSALHRLMNTAWRIRHRDVVHYYALARRLCNALPLKDARPEFSLANRNQVPIWQNGESLTDAQVRQRFQDARERLASDGDPTVHFSRYLDRVSVPGEEAGPSRIHAQPQSQPAVSRFRRGLLGYLVTPGAQTVHLGVGPTSKPVRVKVFFRDDVIFEQEYRKPPEGERFHAVTIELPRAFEYRVQISGDFELQVPPDTPLVFEASVSRPAWISYSGPHYFYVPRGTRELVVDANPRLSLIVPGQGRRDVHPAERALGKSHIVIEVPAGADGQVWHTTTQTRGEILFLNTPPLLSFHRGTIFVPREVSESEGLSTQR